MRVGETYIEGPVKGRVPDARLQDRGFQGSDIQAQRYNDAVREHVQNHRVSETRYGYTPDTDIEPGDTCTYPVLLVGGQTLRRTIELT